MEITFTSSSLPPRILKLNYPTGFVSDKYVDERQSVLHESWGNARLNEWWFEGVCLYQNQLDLVKPCSLQVKSDQFCWMMSFVLDGDIQVASGTTTLNMQTAQYFASTCKDMAATITVQQRANIFTICLTGQFLNKLFNEDVPAEMLISAAALTQSVPFNNHRGARIGVLINEIIEAKQPLHIRRIYLESKIMELISIQLEKQEQPAKAVIAFSPEDIACLQEAKSIVVNNLQAPCSLIELARKTGLNDFKLKKGFKALFGHTVFGYIAKLRMETAHQLLRTNKSVSEVAEIVGYKNPHHFTAAFKKHYGLLPSQVGK